MGSVYTYPYRVPVCSPAFHRPPRHSSLLYFWFFSTFSVRPPKHSRFDLRSNFLAHSAVGFATDLRRDETFGSKTNPILSRETRPWTLCAFIRSAVGWSIGKGDRVERSKSHMPRKHRSSSWLLALTRPSTARCFPANAITTRTPRPTDRKHRPAVWLVPFFLFLFSPPHVVAVICVVFAKHAYARWRAIQKKNGGFRERTAASSNYFRCETLEDRMKKTKANTERVCGEDIVRRGRPRDRTPRAANRPGYDETFTPYRVCSAYSREHRCFLDFIFRFFGRKKTYKP